MDDYVSKLDAIAESYHNANVPDKFIEEISQEQSLTWIFEKLEGKRCILELGYGDGIINKQLLANGFSVDVIEGSPKVIARAKSDNPSLNIQQTLFEAFQTDKTYDCILALHVLEHVDDPVNLLKMMAGWLSENGELVIIVPNKNSIHRQLAVEMGLQNELDDLSPRDLAVGHQRVYSHETLREDIEKAGFKVIEETGFFLKTLPNGMMLEHSHELITAMNTIADRIPRELLANIGMIIKIE
ncbi:class I SAM-dependent methyltransferase [Alkalimarinus alittae]|uniref:Class I SAM-dependent methyltransferase n=1 Tax=Alkalimarinus alittae TaxID=2961619 RepID=A0ABY6N604_9ALTE|nr:class I SAM-dependent methyltransferase [Alkalimarinus alittae]UZE97556.1 class I SAM-dependent methyltransferase [Alkalimarinus alittae]